MNHFARPTVLLLSCVVLPALLLAGAGAILLQHERERWEQNAREAELRWLEQSRRELQLSMEALQEEFRAELENIARSEQPEQALMELQDEHPLVRNVFRSARDGRALYPVPGLNSDEETRRFLLRYDALFSGRLAWNVDAELEEPQLQQESTYNSFIKGIGRASKAWSPAAPMSLTWRAWHWEDQDAILIYVSEGNGYVGVELEMAALWSRVDVLLRNISEGRVPLGLIDRHGRPLTISMEPKDNAPHLELEMGDLLPFARLQIYAPMNPSSSSSGFLYAAALLFGLILLASILAGGIGLNAWLQRSRREALQKTTFVSNVSHEFKTPLTTLRLYSELLLEGRVEDPERQKRYLRTLLQESDRLARLVHNVLDFSRLEMGKRNLQIEDFDLCDGFDAVHEALTARLQGAAFRIYFPEAPVPVHADRDAAGQILLNLCDNAVKYAAQGERLDIQALEHEGHWQLRFQDYGQGLDSKQRRGLFQAFHQSDSSLTREQGGTGLGLHISRRLAREMGGDLSLCPTSEGACFLWTLPRATEITT